jgi:hypothetical protein
MNNYNADVIYSSICKGNRTNQMLKLSNTTSLRKTG